MSDYLNKRRQIKLGIRPPDGKKVKENQKDLQELILEADKLFSNYIRLKAADSNGWVQCFTCSYLASWKIFQAGHFIKRDILYLRHDERNVKVQCVICNVEKKGNLKEFEKRLEAEKPGIVTILQEDARIIFKPTREEIEAVIKEYRLKVKLLKKAH